LNALGLSCTGLYQRQEGVGGEERRWNPASLRFGYHPGRIFVRNLGEGLNVLNSTTILHCSRKEHCRPGMIVWENIHILFN
jgi:hypothetical protein